MSPAGHAAAPVDELCSDKAGVFFPHDCKRQAMHSCWRCRRPICGMHRHDVPQGMQLEGNDGSLREPPSLCTTCARQVDTGENFGDSPFFYGPRYYPRFGTFGHWSGVKKDRFLFEESEGALDDASHADDADDLNDSDGESTLEDGDESFEKDVSGS